MKILIVRHAKAQNKKKFRRQNLPDEARPLTKEGRREMKAAARGLVREIPRIHHIVSSPLRRAVQTAQILLKVYKTAKFLKHDGLKPEAGWHALLQWLQSRPSGQVVALVGHEPDLSRLESWLLSGQKNSFVELKKGAVALLETPAHWKPGQARLFWQLWPAHLKKLKS